MSRRFRQRRWKPGKGMAAILEPEKLLVNLYASYCVGSTTTVVSEGRITAMGERLGRGAAFSMAVLGDAGPMYSAALPELGNRPAMYQGTDEAYGLGSLDPAASMTNGSSAYGLYVVGVHVSDNATKAIVGARNVDSYLGSTPADHGIVYTNGKAAQDNAAMSDQGFAAFVNVQGTDVSAYVYYANGATHSWSTTGGPPSSWLGLTMMARVGNDDPWPGALAECGFASAPFTAGERDALLFRRLKPLYGLA